MNSPLAWMAWTPPTAMFFLGIATLLVLMAIWQRASPRNAPRIGLLGLPLQRGDRLFVTLLGAAFIHLVWIGVAPKDAPLWLATVVSILYAGLVFRFA